MAKTMQRRRYSTAVKRELVEKFDRGDINERDLKDRYQLSKHDIIRFKKQIDYAVEKLGIPQNGNRAMVSDSMSAGSSNFVPTGDQRDRLIMQLKLQLADLSLENAKLRAMLGGNRYTDAIFLDQRGNRDTVK